MLKIKLSKRGTKNAPTYRIIVCEHTKDPWGDFLEILGHYNPRMKGKQDYLVVKTDRIKHWISKGAQPTDTVHNILVSEGILKDKKKSVSSLGKKHKAKLEGEKKEKEEAKSKEKKEESPKEETKPEEKKEESKPEEKKDGTPKEEAKPEEKKDETSKEETG